jgi:hypothetical protein
MQLGCGMNIVAALLYVFVLKPIINVWLKKPAAVPAHDLHAMPVE